MKIPFWLLPASWGLKGKSRRIAEAEYYLTGIDLEKELAKIELARDALTLEIELLGIDRKYGFISEYDYEKKVADLEEKEMPSLYARLLRIDRRFGKITDYEFDRKMVENEDLPETDKKIELLRVDKKHDKIGETEFEKQRHDLLGLPYVGVISAEIDSNNPKSGYFELDWNDIFVNMLITSGYSGKSEEVIVNSWFNDLCRTIALQEYAVNEEGESSNETDLGGGLKEVR